MLCQSELRGLGAVARELQSQGGQLFAVSVDPPELSQKVVTRNKLPFSILSDEQKTWIKPLGVLHRGGGPTGSDIAIPAQFLFDRQGRLVWRYISDRAQVRIHPEEVLRQVKQLRTAPDT